MTSISSADGTRLTSKLSILIASPFTTFKTPLWSPLHVFRFSWKKKVQKFPRYDKLILHFHVFFRFFVFGSSVSPLPAIIIPFPCSCMGPSGRQTVFVFLYSLVSYQTRGWDIGWDAKHDKKTTKG